MAEKMAEQERGVSTNKNNNKKWETFIVGFTLPQADQNNPKLKKKKVSPTLPVVQHILNTAS